MYKTMTALPDVLRKVVKVDRTKTPKQVIGITDRVRHMDTEVVESMPKGDGDEVEVHFFKLDRYISDTDLEKEYELRGLKPCDPYSLVKVNELDPSFANACPNNTHWKDSKGRWCFIAFYRWNNKLSVHVSRRGGDWTDEWWFAGLCK